MVVGGGREDIWGAWRWLYGGRISPKVRVQMMLVVDGRGSDCGGECWWLRLWVEGDRVTCRS